MGGGTRSRLCVPLFCADDNTGNSVKRSKIRALPWECSLVLQFLQLVKPLHDMIRISGIIS